MNIADSSSTLSSLIANAPGNVVSYTLSGGGQTVLAANYNLTLSNSNGIQTAVGNITVNGTLTTTAGGTFSLSTFTLSKGDSLVVSNVGTIQTNCTTATSTNPLPAVSYGTKGMVIYGASTSSQTIIGTSYKNLTFNNTSGADTLGGDTTVNGSLTLASGTLEVSSSNYGITLLGDFINSVGKFNSEKGTVILSTIANQSITGTNTFYNLQKQVTNSCSLTLPADSANAQKIVGKLTLNGASTTAVLTIVSDNPGNQAFINPTSVGAVSYVNVSDNNTSLPITAINSINGDNNTGWLFSGNIALHGSATYSSQEP